MLSLDKLITSKKPRLEFTEKKRVEPKKREEEEELDLIRKIQQKYDMYDKLLQSSDEELFGSQTTKTTTKKSRVGFLSFCRS